MMMYVNSRMKRNILAIAATVAIAGINAAQAQSAGGAMVSTAPGYAAAAHVETSTATVTAIDIGTRQVTLRREDGRTFTLVAGDEVRNLPQLRVGDTVNVDYVDALTLELKKGGTGLPASRTESTSAVRAEPGARPGGAVARETTIVADVVAVDSVNRTVSLRGPKRNVVTLPTRDPEQFKLIAVGDQVEATYVEAVAVGITPVAPTPVATTPVAPSSKPFSVFVFLWAPSIDGNFSVRNPLNGDQAHVSVNVTPREIFSNLDAGLMLYGDWTSDRWSVFGDFTYTKLSPSKDKVGVFGYSDVGTSLKTSIGDLAVAYQVWGASQERLELYAGARYYKLDNSVTLNVPDESATAVSKDDWVDAIGGARFRTQLAPRWVSVAQIDYGAGGSNHSWQAWGYVGYEFDWGSIGGGWRYLTFSRDHNGNNTDMSYNGPILGVVAKF